MNGPGPNLAPLVRAGCNAAEIAAFTGVDEDVAEAAIADPTMHQSRHQQINALSVGVASSFEHALRFSAWVSQLRQPLTMEAIRDRFSVSRATAYRWLAAWKSVHGDQA